MRQAVGGCGDNSDRALYLYMVIFGRKLSRLCVTLVRNFRYYTNTITFLWSLLGASCAMDGVMYWGSRSVVIWKVE
jgi:hypothetical protein